MRPLASCRRVVASDVTQGPQSSPQSRNARNFSMNVAMDGIYALFSYTCNNVCGIYEYVYSTSGIYRHMYMGR